MKNIIAAFITTVCFTCIAISGGMAQEVTNDALSRMIDALGGAGKLSDIKTSVMKGRMILVSQGNVPADITITNLYPDRVLIEMTIMGALISQGYDGKVGWINNPFAGGLQELPAEELASMKYQAIGNAAFLNPGKFGIKYTYKGKSADSVAEYNVIEQSFDDGFRTTEYYVDASTYLVYKTKSNRGNPVQPLFEEVFYADYRQTNGITQAHRISTFLGGQETIRILIDRIEYNTEVDTGIFRMPERRFTRAELIADARQLASIIETTHPDPYRQIGGKIAFHRSLHHVLRGIPDSGMTNAEFTALLRPFVAAIGDGHTEVYAPHNVNPDLPGGVPLKFEVAEQSLYVSGVPGDQYKAFLGAILIAVENVSVDELGRRLRILRPIDNEYHLLWYLTTNYLWYGPYLQELLPEWKDMNKLQVSLRLASGKTEEVVFDLPMAVASLSERKSRITLPAADTSGLGYGFLRDGKKPAYVRIDHMQYYRESFEARNSLGLERTSQEKLDSIPSATEFFRSLVVEMKKAGTEAMIVDLRHNGGGNDLMADIMMYFLYGKEAVHKTRWNNISRLSPIYLEARKGVTLSEMNKDRAVPLVEGDYDFSEDYSDPVLCRAFTPVTDLTHSPTFQAEWESGTYEGYYCPKRVIVLTRPWTYSAGFGIAVRLYQAGAILVGTPSGQAPNSGGGNAAKWKLNNTLVAGRVSQACVQIFPDNSELSEVLPVHYPLKYKWLASHDFDPNAEVLYALELLPKLADRKK